MPSVANAFSQIHASMIICIQTTPPNGSNTAGIQNQSNEQQII